MFPALETAVEHLLEGIQVISFDWTYLYVNRTAAAHGRRDASELVGRSMPDCYPGIEQTALFGALQRVMRTRRAERLLNEFTYPDGTAAWFELLVDPFPDGICVLSLDVSDRRSTELQLRQAQKLESLGRLAGGIAHDFNNLLTAILGYSDLLLTTPLSDDVTEQIREIQHAGERAGRLTRQLLAFTRQRPPAPGVLDLNALIVDAHNMLERLLEDVRIELDLHSAGTAVVGDPTHLEQALLNLAVNARDAMPEGGALRIRTAPAARERLPADLQGAGAFVALTVEDTGAGMPPEVLARAIDPFFTTKPEGQGTGLGLATVNDVVRELGGSLAIDSTPGVGTAVTLFLRAGEATTGRAVPRGTAGSPFPGGSETILLAERDAVTRAFLRKVLRACGYHVLEANGSRQALDLAAQHAGTIDVVVTDIVSPDLHGGHLAQRLIGQYPAIKVLFVSGGTLPPEFAARLGAHARVLQKPFTAAALVPAVRELIDQG